MKPILEVKNLTKNFDGFKAVDNISFTLGEGEILGFLGPNGAGKTTTIFMLIDLIAPTSGEISIFGMHYSDNREAIRQQINYSSTYMEMSPRLTVYENLYTIGKFYQVKNSDQVIRNLSDKFELTSYLNKLQRDLSAGQKTRVYLAKSFLNSPKLLLLDEPTASLDPDVAEVVRDEILAARKRGMTVLVTSHNMAEVEAVCDRVIFINSGKIIAEDTPEGLAKKVRKIRVHLMIKDGQKRTLAFTKKAGFRTTYQGRFVSIEVDEGDIAYLLSELAESGVEYSEISIDKPTLEDYFIKIAHGGKS
jgi:ABC-2 type transport system ATP-binding protein